MNYWGYSTVGFFAPKAGLRGHRQARHAGRRVEGAGQGAAPQRHRGHPRRRVQPHGRGQRARAVPSPFAGIDNKTYYMLTPEGYYYNFSGTGNTLNCNNPVVRNMVLDCLRYWAAEYHIDGFRFDLAVDPRPRPVGRAAGESAAAGGAGLRSDPGQVQADRRGLGRRRALPGRLVPGLRPLGGVERQVSRLRPQVPQGRAGPGRRDGPAPAGLARPVRTAAAPTASINFITCHDGFTLNDLVSYNDKHNEANGEDNRDGANDNDSWNCGWEGPTDDRGDQRPAPPADQERRGHAAGQPGRAHDPDGRRGRPHPATATTTPIARTTNSTGSTGTCSRPTPNCSPSSSTASPSARPIPCSAASATWTAAITRTRRSCPGMAPSRGPSIGRAGT